MGALIIDKVQTRQDILVCVNMYLKIYDSIIPADYDRSIKSFEYEVKRQKYLRVVRRNSRILAWILADLVHPLHTRLPIFRQLYYASDQTGVLAVKCLQLLHEDMYLASFNTNATYCLSEGSHMDTTQVLARALEKVGWTRKNHMAVREIQRLPS
jgi:hypothetical protein